MDLDWRTGGRIGAERPGGAGGRFVALFLLGLALFTPPLLAVFSSDVLVLGIPLLYLYLFGAWAALIALVRLANLRGGYGSAPDRSEDGG